MLGLVRNMTVVVLRPFGVLGNCLLFGFKAALWMSSETKYFFCTVASFTITLMQIQSNCLEADELFPHIFSFSFTQLFFHWWSQHLHLEFCWTVKLPALKCEHYLSSCVWLINFVVIKYTDKEELPLKMQFGSCVLPDDYYNIRRKGFSWQYSTECWCLIWSWAISEWQTWILCSAKNFPLFFFFFFWIQWTNSNNLSWVWWMSVSYNQTATAGKK